MSISKVPILTFSEIEDPNRKDIFLSLSIIRSHLDIKESLRAGSTTHFQTHF